MNRFSSTVLVLTAGLVLAGCVSGPDYRRPAAEAPLAYKGATGWKVAQPADHLPRGPWWEVFGDAQLNSLVAMVEVSNFNIQIAEAQYRQARALGDAARAAFLPSVGANASATRSGSGGGSGGAGLNTNSTRQLRLSASVGWEIDVWGRLARTSEARQAGIEASAADLGAARLSAQALLVRNYFQLRQVDAQKQLFDSTLDAYKRSLEVTNNRYNAGVVARLDVIQAEALLRSTQVQSIDLGILRARLEHAIAVSIGRPPAAVTIAFAPLAPNVPAVPGIGLPTELLERRPDIASAERRMAAANASIGVAQAASYPSLSLSAGGGFAGSTLGNLLSLPNSFWSFGPALAMSLFDGGARKAQTAQAEAGYDATVASYRQTVLNGFREVEDALAALRILEEEAQVQEDALKASRYALSLVNNQYKAGTVSFLNVVSAQATALSNERNALGILGDRVDATVQLITALGGGWSSTDRVALQRATP